MNQRTRVWSSVLLHQFLFRLVQKGVDFWKTNEGQSLIFGFRNIHQGYILKGHILRKYTPDVQGLMDTEVTERLGKGYLERE